VTVLETTEQDEVVQAVRDLTDGRGPDAVIDAVGMEAHGSPGAKLAQKATALVPDAVMEKVMQVAGVDRLAALNTAIEAVRRGGTISLSGVYGGATDPLPLMRMFDKQIQLRMGQANVWRWVPDILPLLLEGDPLGVDDFATHRVGLEDAPQAYSDFREKKAGAVKVLLQP
jgi:threonine dehydrogenase-like Zn-dependent dehydrogenase